MAGYLSSRIQAKDFRELVSSFVRSQETPTPPPIFVNDITTSTTSLNAIPVDAIISYPPPVKSTTWPRPQTSTRTSRTSFKHKKHSIFLGYSNENRPPPHVHYDKSTDALELDVKPKTDEKEIAEILKHSVISETSSTASGNIPHTNKLINRTTSLVRNIGDSQFSFDSQTFADGTPNLMSFSPVASPLNLKPDGAQNASVPPLSIICFKMYIIEDLFTTEKQDTFFSRTYLVKAIQLFTIVAWMMITTLVPEVHSSISEHYNIWLYTPLCSYIVLLTLVRWIPCKTHRTDRCVGIIYVLMTISVALALGAIEVKFKIKFFFLTTLVLFCSTTGTVMLTWYGSFRVMSKKIIVVTQIIVCMTVFVFVLTAKMYTQWNVTWDELGKLWVPVLAMTSIIMLLHTLEMKCAIAGRRFPISAADWLFAACFL